MKAALTALALSSPSRRTNPSFALSKHALRSSLSCTHMNALPNANTMSSTSSSVTFPAA